MAATALRLADDEPPDVQVDRLLTKAEVEGHYLWKDPSLREKLLDIVEFGNTGDLFLVHGESGTGKDYLSGLIHYIHGKGELHRSNVAALVGSGLADREFYGHVKGAFTGATEDKKGLFGLIEQSGSLHLDEVGALPLESQARLLRVLDDDREFSMIGSTDVRKAKGTIVCSTNADLQALVAEGKFRPDLEYRLRTARTTKLSPIANRTPDHILGLVRFLIRKRLDLSKRINVGPDQIDSKRLQNLILEGRVSGNIRGVNAAIDTLIKSVVRGRLISDDELVGETQNQAIQKANPLERVVTICLDSAQWKTKSAIDDCTLELVKVLSIEGNSVPEIAARLGIGLRTVGKYRQLAFGNTGKRIRAPKKPTDEA